MAALTRAAGNGRPARRPVLGIEGRTWLLFAALVLPALALRLFTAVWPIAKTIEWSFMKVGAMGVEGYAGTANYARFANDPVMLGSLRFSVIYVGGSTVLQIVLGFLAALLLNSAFPGRRFARTINLIPWAVPLIVAAMGFRWIFDEQYGLVNDLLARVGFGRIGWLTDAWSAQFAVVVANTWRNTPFIAMVFLAGLQGVPKDLYEAASLDGASRIAMLRYITIPLVMPLVITMSLFFAIWQLASFDLIYGMTEGGPGFATSVLAWQIYKQAFQAFDFGYAAAISVALLGVIALVGIAGYWLFKRREVVL